MVIMEWGEVVKRWENGVDPGPEAAGGENRKVRFYNNRIMLNKDRNQTGGKETYCCLLHSVLDAEIRKSNRKTTKEGKGWEASVENKSSRFFDFWFDFFLASLSLHSVTTPTHFPTSSFHSISLPFSFEFIVYKSNTLLLRFHPLSRINPTLQSVLNS